MADTVIEGTKQQLRSYFNKQSEEQRIKLTLVEEDEETIRKRPTTYPGNAVCYNGIPLLPDSPWREPVTLEKVKQILDEEYEIPPKHSLALPDDTVFFHGIPLLPILEGGTEMTLDRVKELLGEDF